MDAALALPPPARRAPSAAAPARLGRLRARPARRAARSSRAASAITVLSQIGIAIVACLSYNMLLGQGGMLSFGHAVYTGLGTFVAVHAHARHRRRLVCRCR